MRKIFSRIVSIILVIGVLFVHMPVAHAAGSATVTLSASSTTPSVGGTVEVTVGLSNITNATNGVAGFQGTLAYDSDILEIDEAKQTPIAIGTSYSDSTKTIAGISIMPATHIKTTSSGLVKLTFKVKAAGSATIRVTNTEVSAGNNEVLSSGDASITLNASVPVPKSTNANLKSLSITGYAFNETFDKDTTNYTVTVPHNVGSVTINAQAEDTKVKSINNTGNKTLLAAGQTSTFTVTVTAEDGKTKKSYVVNIAREAAPYVESSDNNLKSLGVDGYSMSPAFNRDTLNYEVRVPNDATEVIINSEKNDSKAKVEVTGNKDLKVGENTVLVKVTAENGSVKTYTIKVVREEEPEPIIELDTDATLKELNISGYTLNPKFDKTNNVYSITVGDNITGLDIDAMASSDKAKVEITGNKGWQYGINNVTIVVTAENGNKNTYIVNVNRKNPEAKDDPKSDNNYLKDLSVVGASLNPKFDKDVSNYTITLPYDISKLNITHQLEDSKAKVEIIGNTVLTVGTVTSVQVKVTAEDGSIRIYTINATRSSKTSNTYLKELSATGFSLSPAFDKATTNYTMDVKSNTKSLDLKAIASNSKAKVEILGNENFKEGKNTVLIKVTDENGFQRVYQIDVMKPAKTIFGLPLFQFYMWFFIIIALIALGILLIALLKRKKKEIPPITPIASPTPDPTPVIPQQPTPIIEFKPEFNFGSKNGTDDDVVYQGTLNQGNAIPMQEAPKNLIEEVNYEEANYDEIENDDVFDDTVTKTEIIEAIKEGMETKNSDKLKMLLKQEELNQLKKEIKEKEKRKRIGRER